MNQKKFKNSSPRIKIIQKIYNSMLNPGVEIEYPKNQYKKFIKDVVSGTLERSDYIEETINKKIPDDIDLVKTDKLLKIILFASIYELLFKQNTPTKVIISEYLKVSDSFVDEGQKSFLNAILEKASKISRITNE